MTQTIKSESKRNAKNSLDLDNLRTRFREFDAENDIEVHFPGFELSTYEQNFFKLLAKSKKEKFLTKWYQRPDYVSQEFYGTNIFWSLILFVNRVQLIEEFVGFDEILVPPYDLILEMAKDRLSIKDVITINQEEDLKSESRFFKTAPLDEKEIDTLKGKQQIEDVEFTKPPEEDLEVILDGGGTF